MHVLCISIRNIRVSKIRTCKDNRKTRVSNMHYILNYRHTRYVKAIERQSSFVACCSSLVARCLSRSLDARKRSADSFAGKEHTYVLLELRTQNSGIRALPRAPFVVYNSKLRTQHKEDPPLAGGGQRYWMLSI